MSVTLPRPTAAADKLSLGKRTIPIWVKGGGLYLGTTYKTVYGSILPDLRDLPSPAGEPINEGEYFEVGHKPSNYNEGLNWTVTLNSEGMATELIGSLIGQRVSTNPVIENGQTLANQGHLILYRVDESETVIAVDVIKDLGVNLYNIQGGSDGENQREIALWVKDGQSWTVHGGNPVAFEIFVTNANDTNTAAPNGTNTVFTLGDGNRSYATAAPPDILAIDTAANPLTGLKKYFFWLRLNGVDVTDAEATFNPSTKELTFVTAPANNLVLEMGYLVDKAGTGAAGQPPYLWSSGNMMTSWKVKQS